MEGIERPKPYESTTEQVCRNKKIKIKKVIKNKEKKKDGGKEEKKKNNDLFPRTAALELQRRRRLIRASG